MTQSEIKLTPLQMITRAIANDDYNLAREACAIVDPFDERLLYAAIRTRGRFIAYPNINSTQCKMSCKSVTDEDVKALADDWADFIKSQKNPSKIVAEVIADKDSHPVWKDRAIAVLADNEFSTQLEDREFAKANLRAAIYYVPIEHPRFDALAGNIARHFEARFEHTELAVEKLSATVQFVGNTEATDRIIQLALPAMASRRPAPRLATDTGHPAVS